MAENVLRFTAGFFGDHLHKRTFGRGEPDDREHILLHIDLLSVVLRPVHVDRKAGDHQKIPVNVDKTGRKPVRCTDNDAARDGERAVEPGLHDKSAVSLHIQTDVSVSFHLGIHFDLHGGAVGVAGSDHKAGRTAVRDAEGYWKYTKDYYSESERTTYYKIVEYYNGDNIYVGRTLAQIRELIRDNTYRMVI